MNAPEFGNRRLARWGPMFALVGLCLIWAFGALVPDLVPNVKPRGAESLVEHSFPFVLVAGFAGLRALFRGELWPSGKELLILAGIGCGLFVLPELMVRWTLSGVSAYERTLLFSLVPVMSIALEPHFGRVSDVPLRGGLMAALACAAGAWLVFPANLPSTLSAGLALGTVLIAALLIAAMSCLAQKLLYADRESSQRKGIIAPGSARAAAMASGGALGFVLAQTVAGVWKSFAMSTSLHFHWAAVAWAVIDATGQCLLLWLLPLLRPSRAATRYVFAPVLTVVLGVLLLRVAGQWHVFLQLRTVAGLLIMSAGGIYLVTAPEPQANDDAGRGLELR